MWAVIVAAVGVGVTVFLPAIQTRLHLDTPGVKSTQDRSTLSDTPIAPQSESLKPTRPTVSIQQLGQGPNGSTIIGNNNQVTIAATPERSVDTRQDQSTKPTEPIGQTRVADNAPVSGVRDGTLSGPKPLSPNWGQGTQVEAGDFTILAAPCIMAASNLRCFFRITNQSDHDLLVDLNGYAGPIRLVDDNGNEYRTQEVQVGASKGNQIQSNLPSGTPILGSATFDNFTGNSVALLEIFIWKFEGQPKLAARFKGLSVMRREN